ncbi:nucleotide exchange factor Sil1 [Phymastichus coffea]|uniref:nucleotide exchange factor Sil1 n=1 Tax=Phymastichus coffea TaxID=108790 RepID=UPI00273AEC66|nr:nucleotide exchange factor Sil1 [Phymastichus coffea]
MRYVITLLLVIFCTIIVNATETTKNDSVFVPTKEWQTVKKGISIPQGLHIRHNLQTGVIEAKLMDDDNDKEKSSEDNLNSSQQNSLTLHPEKSLTDEENHLLNKDEATNKMKIPIDELKAMLKRIKSDDSSNSNNAEATQPERRKKFRSYVELKEELEALNMNVSTDSQILNGLFSQFESQREFILTENLDSAKVEDVMEILNNIEYLIHQIDNARTFTDMGGMSKIISPCLNSTNPEIKAEALKLLGAAVQSNPRVQLKALENDFIQKILHLLTVNNVVVVKARCLFALGALVRHFPAAQKALVDNGGLEIFGKILADGHFQVQARVMNLVNDLIIERQNLDENRDNLMRIQKLKEYESTNLEHKLVMQEYCQNLIDLAINSLKTNSDVDDFFEVIYESIITLHSVCKKEILNKEYALSSEVKKMLIKYRDFPNVNEDDENLNTEHLESLEEIENILSKLRHDEL